MKKSILTFLFFMPALLFGQAQLVDFGGAAWGNQYVEVERQLQALKNKARSDEKVDIIDKKIDKYMIFKRDDIKYQYRFFKKESALSNPSTSSSTSTGTSTQGTASLYSVGVFFSPVPFNDLKQMIVGKYKSNPKEILDDDKKPVALLWDLSSPPALGRTGSTGGYIVQWIETYKNKQYSKRIDYFGAEITKVINKNYEEYFSERERKVLDLLSKFP